ncbi:phage tail protein I [Desulfobaculum bizertense]|uniref:phage tail protein I n=1 Tax=Desulfobaculum bizertense TaxID=376490 RepID=UPI001F3198A6|nr:phage tail protein I [Desulfobaculum bizertense]UIJ38556.1 phage tail protein I [Desulfobaculum bizertense]
MATLFDIHLEELLPDSLQRDAGMLALAELVQQELSRAVADLSLPQILARVDELHEPVLSLLAAELRVVFWDAGLPEEKKRELLRTALVWRMHHGTVWCVEEALAMLYGNGRVREWFETGRPRGTFRVEVEVDGQGLTPELYAQIERVVDLTKRKSQHPEGIRASLCSTGCSLAACCMGTGEQAVLYPLRPEVAPVCAASISAAGVQSVETGTVYPKSCGGEL